MNSPNPNPNNKYKKHRTLKDDMIEFHRSRYDILLTPTLATLPPQALAWLNKKEK